MTLPNGEDRLSEVIAAYLAALDAGSIPDREALLTAHPSLADDLRAFFANQDHLEELAVPLRLDSANEATEVHDAGESTDLSEAATLAGQATGGNGVAVGERLRYFGDYELIEELGRGGMGVVFQARQVSLNRMVALKLIRSADLASEDELRRFQNEAEAVAQLDHPGIVPIIEIGEHEGQKYFSMKLIAGRGLDAAKAEYAADPRAAACLVAAAARAVHHAHLRGILHRDLKPSNILLDGDSVPHVTDFGLAKKVETDSGMTQSGAIMGTPSYMAPEQASGKRGLVTTASDVYGLGAVLYELLAGRPPFQGESVLDTLVLTVIPGSRFGTSSRGSRSAACTSPTRTAGAASPRRP
jgi:serine/threonine-protein kinase